MSTETHITVVSDSAPALPAIAPPADGVLPPPIELSQKQTDALEAIMAGKSTADILAAAKVDRTTLWRWRTFDANFVAALNQWRHDVQARVRDRVVNVIEDAAETVQVVVRERDGRLALTVLDKSGNLKMGPTDPIDPYSIFGAGINDQNGRHAALVGFLKARDTLSAEQAQRVVQIFAMGVVLDNDRLGRTTPDFIREMARFPEPLAISDGSIATEQGHDRPDEGSQKSTALPDPEPPPARDGPRVKSPTFVTARVVDYLTRARTFLRR